MNLPIGKRSIERISWAQALGAWLPGLKGFEPGLAKHYSYCYRMHWWKTGREPCLYLGVWTVTVYVSLSFVWTWTYAYVLLWTDGLPL